jgi:hypothetical protein
VGVEAIEHALVLLVLGEQPPEELPSIAADALVAGVDSPSLRLVAGTPTREYQDARELFIAAANELRLPVPTPEEARWCRVREWAQAMVDGSVSPYEASRRIWGQGWDELGRPESLTAFVGLASEWEDDEPRRSQYEDAMLNAARRFLQEHA